MVAYFCPLYAKLIKAICNLIMFSCNLYMLTYNIPNKSHVIIIILNVIIIT